MLATAQSTDNTEEHEAVNPYATMMPINKTKDNKMKERYLDMKMENNNQNYSTIQRSFTEEDDKIKERKRRASPIKYASLQSLTSSVTSMKLSFDVRSQSLSMSACEYRGYKKMESSSRGQKIIFRSTQSV